MGVLMRVLLLVAGAVAALFVAQDSPNFVVIQGMVAVVLVAAVVLVLALARRK
jgi:hypothetical protein